jgi:thiol-disulfide isomerase/thioredoxin
VSVDRARVRAPELRTAGHWIGTDALSLADLRGKIVLLDFWTQGCINCIRTVEELRRLEGRFRDELVVLGVHSPKFAHEHDADAVRAAVARLRITHPVLDDPGMVLWDQYAVKAWPTLVLIDATGRVARTVSGEGHAEELERAVAELVAEAEADGILARGPLAVRPPGPPPGTLAFPGKVCADDVGLRLAIADTGHDRVLVTGLDGTVLHEIGDVRAPQGVRFDDGGAALLICETGADRVLHVELGSGVRTIVTDAPRSPWDVIRWQGHVVVAEAGTHRLLGVDRAGEAQVVAGTGAEGLLDGPAFGAVLAQPSGLAVTRLGDLAWVDAEASALRLLDPRTLQVRTLVGQGLFTWGSADGDAQSARLQHPLGVAATRDLALAVADTYNGLLRVHRGSHLWTLPVEGFREPGGIDVLADGRWVVADTGNHRVVLVDPRPDPPLAVALDVGA